MTREEAKNLPFLPGYAFVTSDDLVDKIYDEFERRKCENCNHFIKLENDEDIRCHQFHQNLTRDIIYCGNWEPKDD